MAIELRFSKDDDAPWGFRLTGGADCDVPLTVIKVFEDSFAENAGLQTDDIIVRINDVSLSGLTHLEAHDVLVEAGRDFTMAIRRGDGLVIAQEDELNNQEVCTIMESSLEPQNFSAKLESKREEIVSSSVEFERMLKNSNVTDEQIAEAISAEAEVLPDQNVLGVNFNKIDLSGSRVLKVLKEQKEDGKIDLTNKKWSTFLQIPQRPRLMPKKKEPEGPVAEPYRVIIKKQKKKNVETMEETVQETSETEQTETQTEHYDEEESLNIEETQEEDEVVNQELNEEEDEQRSEISEASKGDENLDEEREEESNEEKPQEVTTTVGLSLEEQLAQVQQQLQQLAQLPSTIQVTLDAVTQQLAKIVRASNRHGEEEEIRNETQTISEEIEEQFNEGQELVAQASEGEAEEREEDTKSETSDISLSSNRDPNEEAAEEENLEPEEDPIDQEMENEKSTQQERKMQQTEEHHQRRLEQRPTQPLTPLQRPIILPGGRKWSQPDDAVPVPKKSKMSDEKICATLETYSEVITGRTKGYCGFIAPCAQKVRQKLFERANLELYRQTFAAPFASSLMFEACTDPPHRFRESNCFMVPSKTEKTKKINFLKYQPPPKNLDYLQRSEVYRLIHDMEPPSRGIAARPSKVVSEEDYYVPSTSGGNQQQSVQV